MVRSLPLTKTVTASLAAVALIASFSWSAPTPPPRPAKKKPPQPKLPDLKTPEDKLKFLEAIRSSFPTIRSSNGSFTTADLDDMLRKYVTKETKTPFMPIVDDETFLRRVSLDLTGKTPTPEKIKSFTADKTPRKRALLIDELLASDDYSRKWARYWRSVVFHNSAAPRNTVNPQAFEDWLFGEFKENRSWDRVVSEMISASPQRQKDVKPEENGWQQDYGPNNFILACDRKPDIIASETARIFMGISVGCAECHDHPFDKWKREQFHEMAAFFSNGKYYMTDQDDPSKKSEVKAVFLLGEEPPSTLKPDQLRVAAAAYLVYNSDNYWFARAYVNRVWSELVGDGFYSVDSLGPDKDVVHQLIVNRVSSAFRYAGFDPKWLFRLIMNSEIYQRGIRTIDKPQDLFTSVRPARLRPYEVADNMERLTGELKGTRTGLERTFAQNPSTPQRDLEGTVQQALLMMNNGQLQKQLSNSPLKKQLAGIKDNDEAVREAFLAVLARTPSPAEIKRYSEYLKGSKDRNAAIDDMLWVLTNSAEFLVKR
ncbi:MAG TPA: DUF1549 domain-containing protein [Caulifigura sp.]|nr:DUF1549 domain-containing protein [Caulifigura sp.]